MAVILVGCGGAAPTMANGNRDGGGGAHGGVDQGAPTPDGGGGGNGDGGSSGGGGGNITFLSFGTNTTTIDEKTNALIFTAVLTDSKGPADIVGGALVSPDGQIHYGAFVTSHTQGAYELSLAWAALEDAAEITFLKSTTRTFEADFFDAAGNKSWRTVTITLQCSGGGSACKGRCGSGGSADDPRYCGGCPVECTNGACVDEKCVTTLQAVTTGPTDPYSTPTCDEVCAKQSLTCTPSCGSTNWAGLELGNGGQTSYLQSCSQPDDGGFGYCCCH